MTPPPSPWGTPGTFEVLKQLRKEDGFWIMVNGPDPDPDSVPQWVRRSEVSLVDEDTEVWIGLE